MKQFAKLAVVMLGLSALANVATAATQGSYAGLGATYSQQQTPSKYTVTPPTAFTQSSTLGGLGGQAFVGYNFNQLFGLEAGLAYYAQSKYKVTTTTTVKGTSNLDAASLVGKAYLPLGDSSFNVYGLAGAAYVRNTGTGMTSTTTTQTFTNKQVRPKYGVGVSYDVPASQVTTSLEVSRIQGKGDVKTSYRAIPNADMVSFNLAYNFG